MKRLPYLIALLSFLGVPGHSQVGGIWQKLNVGQSVIQTAIDFPGNQSLTGYTASMSLTYNGNGNIFKTTDGGQSWTSVWFGSQAGLYGASFVSVDTGYVAGLPNGSISWSGFGKTTDGGLTWTSMQVPSNIYQFNDVIFRDANHGMLLAQTNSSAAVYATSNGGTSWQTATGISSGIPNRACHVSGTKYFLVDNSGHIKKSLDDGLSWTTVYSGGPILLGIAFYNDLIGQACGDNGLLLRTTDGGNTWQTQNVTTDIWHQVIYVNQDTIYVVGTPEIIYKSTNGGVSWSNDYPQSTYNNAFYDLVITPSGTTWVCGSQGVLMRKYQLIQANFTATPTTACKGDSVQFTSTSTGNNLTYSWHFEGGSPSASSAKNPRVLYDSAGSFGAKLTISDGALSDSLYKPAYVTVSQTPTPVIILNVNTLISNIPNGNQWYRDGNAIPGATLQSYDIVQTGWYWDVVTQNGCASDTSNNIYKLFVGMEDQNSPAILIYPSPGNGKFTVSYNSGNPASPVLRVYSPLGILVLERSFKSSQGKNTEEVELENIPSGLYTVCLSMNEGIFTGKVIVIR
ncbi:MAG: YCF48-related protein [Bacteroidota bacterium]|jgi:photosystem II stability/assembly factor-like uncharacterized protein